MSDTRRGFLATVTAVGAGLAVGSVPPLGLLWSERGRRDSSPDPGRRWAMAIDLDLCSGCGACVVACRSENNVPVPAPGAASPRTEISWMDVIAQVPVPCLHCEDAPCVKVCPTGATYTGEGGVVGQIHDLCIGCRYCMTACPYARRSFNWSAPDWPEAYENYLNPDVSTRPAGVVEKCSFCYHRVRRAEERARLEGRELSDGEAASLPACAEACPSRAIAFGDLGEPEGLVARLARSPRAFRLLEHLGTRPRVIYLSRTSRDGPP